MPIVMGYAPESGERLLPVDKLPPPTCRVAGASGVGEAKRKQPPIVRPAALAGGLLGVSLSFSSLW